MTEHLDHIAGRLAAAERKIELLRSPVLGSGELEPPVGSLAEFLPEGLSEGLAVRAARDQLPIPGVKNRELYRPGDHFGYWMMGLGDYDKVMSAASHVDVSPGRIYDFGGSTGRVFRHFFCQGNHCEVWTSDFKLVAHEWNQRHMPRGIKAFLNGFTPPLPLPDGYFDVVVAFSVFTHIDELESAWLLELRRVLRAGGLLYVTIHDESFWENMPAEVLAALRRSPNGAELKPSSPFPAPRASFAFSTESYYNCNVFHSRDYLREQWGRYFEIIDIRPLAAERQCVVLLTHDG